MEPIDLKELERKAYFSYNEDGLIDILVGSILLLLGTYITLDAQIPFNVSLYPLWTPRMGWVKEEIYYSTYRLCPIRSWTSGEAEAYPLNLSCSVPSLTGISDCSVQ